MLIRRVNGNQWRITVELTWDVLSEDLEKKHPDDTETDLAARALERVRPRLNSILHPDPSGDRTKRFDSYYILGTEQYR